MSEVQTVFLVDDDAALRESMALMLDQAGFRVRTFDSAHAFLEAYAASDTGCLVLDLRMPGMNGLELQEALQRKGLAPPILFLSGFGDIPATVRAIKGGAVDFLEKPVAIDTLIDRIRHSLEEDRRQRAAASDRHLIRSLYTNLTPREREIMVLATKGLSNKEIAAHLGISPRTVENHRAHVMEKMQADNIAELCHMAAVCLSPGEGPAA